MVVMLTEAPSMTIATSSTNLAQKLMPGLKRGPGVQALRTATPIRIASTSASRYGWPAK